MFIEYRYKTLMYLLYIDTKCINGSKKAEMKHCLKPWR